MDLQLVNVLFQSQPPFDSIFQVQGQLIDLGALRDPPGDRQYQSLLGLPDCK